MRRAHIVTILALASAVAVAAPAIAGGSFTIPFGFSTGGEHKGLETFTNTTTTTTNNVTSTTTTSQKLPGGWDQGKADWKAPLQSSNPVLSTSPVGHGHR